MNKIKLSRRKRELVDLCAKLFHTYSYAGATMKILALEAELEPASFYSHFKSKEDILYIISNEAIHELNQYIFTIEDQAIDKGFTEIVDSLIKYAINMPYSWSVLHSNRHYFDPNSTTFIQYQELNNRIIGVFEREINSWKLKHMDPKVSLSVLYNAISVLADMEDKIEERQNAAEIIREIFLNGIKQ